MSANAELIRVGAAQFAVGMNPEDNLAAIEGYAKEAAKHNVRVLLLPEGLIAREASDPYYAAKHPQRLDGPFVAELQRISERHGLALMGTVHTLRDTV